MSEQAFHAWIDGRRLDGAGPAVELTAPWSGRAAGAVRPAGKTVVDNAVTNARRAYVANRGSVAADRIAWLQIAATEIESSADRIVESAILAIGKPRRAEAFTQWKFTGIRFPKPELVA